MSRNYKLLACLAAITFLFYYDRGVVSIVIEPLKRDLLLSDSEVGVVTGFAFALLTMVALPFANFADNSGRALTLAWALALWSVGTAFTAMAMTFGILFVARMSVGATEAVGTPNIHGVTAESFPAAQLASAFGVIVLAGNLGGACALILGGFLSDVFGWRSVFWIAGAAGAVLAALLRRHFRASVRPSAVRDERARVSFKAAFSYFATLPSFIYLTIAMSVGGIGVFAFFTWVPSLLMRKFTMGTGKAGLIVGLITGSASLLGPVISGLTCDRIARNDPRRLATVVALLLLIVGPLTIATVLASSLTLALCLLFPTDLFLMALFPPFYALTQHLCSNRFRTMGATITGTAVTFVGLLIGPTLVGVLSDWFRSQAGASSLQYAVAATMTSYTMASLLMILSIVRISADLARIRESDMNTPPGLSGLPTTAAGLE